VLKISSDLTYHVYSEDELLNKLSTSYEGLSEEEVKIRLEKYGPNELAVKKKRTKFQLFISQFTNGITYILVAAAIISATVAKYINVAVIIAVVLLNGIIGFVQEAKADEALKALKNLSTPEAKVIRSCNKGTECVEFRIKARELVPGDMILLEAGDKVPADSRLINSVSLEVDEAMLTGESLPVRKQVGIFPEKMPLADRKNLVYSGTIVTSGRGRAIVFATGMQTEMGKITSLIDEAEELESPLQYIVDMHPDQSSSGKLWLLTAGQRLDPHFADYAQAVLEFDWIDFYETWRGELYFEWLREQFENIADITDKY